MQFFYSNNIVVDQNLKQLIILDKVESNHCINVLRYEIGDSIRVVDGKGSLYKGIIKEFTKKECIINVLEVVNDYKKRNYYIHIAIVPTKNHDRLEWFVEKAIEIGVDEISFVDCARALRKQIRMNRINKVAKTAMKQSLKAFLPKINSMDSLKNFIKKNKNMNGFICHLEEGNKKSLIDYKTIINSKKSYVLIGPEGDFDKKEIEYAIHSKLKPVCLGDSRLRTETAGIVACHLMNIVNV